MYTCFSEEIKNEVEKIMIAFYEENLSKYEFLNKEIIFDEDGNVWIENMEFSSIVEAVIFIISTYTREIWSEKIKNYI